MRAHSFPVASEEPNGSSEELAGNVSMSVWAWVAMWHATCADYAAAAAIYEHLSAQSDAELHRRGLSRETLARDILRGIDERT